MNSQNKQLIYDSKKTQKHLDEKSNQDYLKTFTEGNEPQRAITLSSEKVREFVCQLPSEELAIVYLKFWENLEECEIAHELKMSSRMVEHILKIALDRLKMWMTATGEPFSALAICA